MPARHIRVLQLSTIQLIIHNSDWFALRRKMSNHTEPPEGIIFDMDGVLVDSNPFHLERHHSKRRILSGRVRLR